MIKNDLDTQYQSLLKEILDNGVVENFRNGNTLTLINKKISVNLVDGFPIITSKRIFYKKAIAEFIWFLSGSNSTKFLKENGINWWDEWTDENGELKKSYGYQLRNYNDNFDQLQYVINQVKKGSRRAVITLWNPCDLVDQDLPCCYTEFKFYKLGDKLEMIMDFRSSDVFLGLPYDIIVGSLLAMFVANECGLEASNIHFNLGNAHIYEEHKEVATKVSNLPQYELPKIDVKSFDDISEYFITDYKSNKHHSAKLIV